MSKIPLGRPRGQMSESMLTAAFIILSAMPVISNDLINLITGSRCNLDFCSLTFYLCFSSPVSCKIRSILFISNLKAFEYLVKPFECDSG